MYESMVTSCTGKYSRVFSFMHFFGKFPKGPSSDWRNPHDTVTVSSHTSFKGNSNCCAQFCASCGEHFLLLSEISTRDRPTRDSNVIRGQLSNEFLPLCPLVPSSCYVFSIYPPSKTYYCILGFWPHPIWWSEDQKKQVTWEHILTHT